MRVRPTDNVSVPGLARLFIKLTVAEFFARAFFSVVGGALLVLLWLLLHWFARR